MQAFPRLAHDLGITVLISGESFASASTVAWSYSCTRIQSSLPTYLAKLGLDPSSERPKGKVAEQDGRNIS